MDILSILDDFYLKFTGEKGSIGKSGKGKDIFYFVIKKSSYPRIICQYSIHAREYVTTALALKQIEEFINTGKRGTVYFIPAVNPDGIEIALYENPLYKANAFQVDLNVNFDARWGSGVKNLKVAGSENYIGPYPFSESESRALKDFTLRVKPNITVSYHSKGEEIYYEFFQSKKDKERDYLIAKKVAEITGYRIVSTPFSAGGYKDWCIQHLNIPALTIEVGSDQLSHPIGIDKASEIFEKNKGVINLLTESL